MRKILLLLVLFASVAFSAIDECKTDVYFGNGILTKREDAIYNTFEVLEPAIRKHIYSNDEDLMYKHIGKVDYAYNRTDGAVMDLLESLIQKDEGVGLGELNNYVKVAKMLAGLATQKAHDSDLSRQVTQYKESIKNGHRVLLVAHSQGNLFGYEAYKKLDGWMRNYFEAVSVATPMNSDIKSGTPRINWDNDLVAYLAFGNSGWVDNPVRKIGWNPLRPLIGLTYREKRPDDAYTYEQQVGGKSPKGDWKSSEDYLNYRSMAGVLGGLDHLVHAFTFYMGEPLAEKNYFGGGELASQKAKTKILSAIATQLDELEQKPSQWKIKKELGCVCKEKYAVVTHQFDSDTMDKLLKDQKIKNFAGEAEGKIYQAEGTYVRAACGGSTIKEIDEGDACLALESIDAARLGVIEGPNASIKPKAGVVEVTAGWSKAELDYDLVVSWDAGEIETFYALERKNEEAVTT